MSIQFDTCGGVGYLYDTAFREIGGVAHGFSTKLGGVSRGQFAGLNLGTSRGDDPDHVRENYRQFFTAIGAQSGRLVRTNQVHKNHVRVVDEGDIKLDPCHRVDYEADGLATNLVGVNLVIFGADCLPVLFYDPVAKVVAAVHAGWRGTGLNIVEQGVKAMVELGSQPAHILAAIGPGISKCCFETHRDVPESLISTLDDGILPYIANLPNDKYKVDLKGINRHLLLQAGLNPDHISVTDDCTTCLSDRYWSHRILGAERGSMASVIGLT